ncbi:MAG: zinc metalloprotease HtpX, partial [Candidatus Omnitrophica bacterium]|nr:zinc metalloprotease HtpX [Candidatus Omnitrophota bacterium]
ADALAVKLTRDPISLSEALYSISRGWRGIGYIDQNLESLFIINPARNPEDEAEGFFADLFSTHPPISRRIAVLAAMAHSDVKNIQESVVAGEKLRSLSRQMTEAEELRWMLLEDKGGWKGPFTMTQIMATGTVTPDTWVKAVGSETLKQAKDELLLRPFFEGRITGLTKSSLNCPKCKQLLLNEEYEGVTIQRCVFCEGVLVDSDKIPRIVIREEKNFSERLKKVAELAQRDGLKRAQTEKSSGVKSYLKCPKCGSYMTKDYYTFGYAVEADRCDSCKNIWFDKDELEIAQYLREKH